jgi:Zn-finger nucleic acid-binding protein
MNCPVCTNVQLAIAERQGIEIDYCPTCRGVWLDRGELDKLIERADSAYQRPEARGGSDDDHEDDREGGGMFGGLGRKRGRRRESMLGDLFDFG